MIRPNPYQHTPSLSLNSKSVLPLSDKRAPLPAESKWSCKVKIKLCRNYLHPCFSPQTHGQHRLQGTNDSILFKLPILTGFWVILLLKSASSRGPRLLPYKSIKEVQDRTMKGWFQQLSLNQHLWHVLPPQPHVVPLMVHGHASLPAPPLTRLKERQETHSSDICHTKASHFKKSRSKPVTMTGAEPALQGDWVSVQEWAERKSMHVSPPLSLYLPIPQEHSILPSTNYA